MSVHAAPARPNDRAGKNLRPASTTPRERRWRPSGARCLASSPEHMCVSKPFLRRRNERMSTRAQTRSQAESCYPAVLICSAPRSHPRTCARARDGNNSRVQLRARPRMRAVQGRECSMSIAIALQNPRVRLCVFGRRAMSQQSVLCSRYFINQFLPGALCHTLKTNFHHSHRHVERSRSTFEAKQQEKRLSLRTCRFPGAVFAAQFMRSSVPK